MRRIASTLLLVLACALPARTLLLAQCAEEPPLQNAGAPAFACPCFAAGEEAGAVFTAPAADYPIEILRVGIAWVSQFGGNPAQVESAIHIYGAGLPNPGTRIFSLPGPQLQDGFINVFNLEPIPGEIIVNSGSFTVTLEFANANAGNFFAPTVSYDNNGCQPGKNVVRAIPGGWRDACSLGVAGDWYFFVVYRPVSCGAVGVGAVPDGDAIPGIPLMVTAAAAGQITLTWDASCAATDNDYAIYEGTLFNYYSHTSLTCTTTGATTATFTPSSGSTYYIVVPLNGTIEGSYGLDSVGNERPPGASACLPAAAPTCP